MLEMDDILNDFVRAWQTFDADLIIKHLDEKFVYDSQWVFASLDCQGYKEYIQGKFQTLKRNRITIEAEIVEDSYMGGKMMKLIQDGEAPVYYRITLNNDNSKVIKGDLCAF